MRDWVGKVRKRFSLGLVASFMLVTIKMPLLALENRQPEISRWSVGTLNEGERYGIYPMEWYYDGFQTPISKERLDKLINNVEAKIAKLDLEKNNSFSKHSYQDNGTREEVLIRLYNTIGQYKLPSNVDISKGPIHYMIGRGILNGSNKGMEVDKSCTVEQAVVFATRFIEDTYDMVGAGSRGLIWQVEHNGNRAYLLGSIHVGKDNLYPIHKDIRKAFRESDLLVVEANILGENEEFNEVIDIGTYSDGTKLRDNISEETYNKLVDLLDLLNIPVDIYDDFKPWIIANELSTLMVTDASSIEQGADASRLGIDMYFLTNSILEDKPVAELEGLIEQANLFNNMPVDMQEAYLGEIIDDVLDPELENISESVKLMDDWFEKWNEGDIDGFTSSFLHEQESSQNEFEKSLFGKRDQAMADKIIKLLNEDGNNKYFIVIGAGHLVQEDTVIGLLRDEGYKVQRFWK